MISREEVIPEEGFLLIRGTAPLNSLSRNRRLVIEYELPQLGLLSTDLPLPASPSKEYFSWSDWVTARNVIVYHDSRDLNVLARYRIGLRPTWIELILSAVGF